MTINSKRYKSICMFQNKCKNSSKDCKFIHFVSQSLVQCALSAKRPLSKQNKNYQEIVTFRFRQNRSKTGNWHKIIRDFYVFFIFLNYMRNFSLVSFESDLELLLQFKLVNHYHSIPTCKCAILDVRYRYLEWYQQGN